MTPDELAARRDAKRKLGWDECGATGASHDPEDKPQRDGQHYCRYCGAEMLPEETATGRQLAQEAFDAVERYYDWASENEAAWTGRATGRSRPRRMVAHQGEAGDGRLARVRQRPAAGLLAAGQSDDRYRVFRPADAFGPPSHFVPIWTRAPDGVPGRPHLRSFP